MGSATVSQPRTTGVAALEHTADGLVLQRQEAIVTPDAPDRLVQELSLDDGAMIADRA